MSLSLNKENHNCDTVWSNLNFSILRRCIKHSRQCFTTFQNISKLVRNTIRFVVISTLFLVFGTVVKRALVFNILLVAEKEKDFNAGSINRNTLERVLKWGWGNKSHFQTQSVHNSHFTAYFCPNPSHILIFYILFIFILKLFIVKGPPS